MCQDCFIIPILLFKYYFYTCGFHLSFFLLIDMASLSFFTSIFNPHRKDRCKTRHTHPAQGKGALAQAANGDLSNFWKWSCVTQRSLSLAALLTCYNSLQLQTLNSISCSTANLQPQRFALHLWLPRFRKQWGCSGFSQQILPDMVVHPLPGVPQNGWSYYLQFGV